MDPKLRYAAELAARKQRRTLSSFIEWTVDEAVSKTELVHKNRKIGTIKDALEITWDVEEADRLIRLALNFPYLLTYEEEMLWKLVQENDFWWLPKVFMDDGQSNWKKDFEKNPDFVNLFFLRLMWDDFKKVARGEMDVLGIDRPNINHHQFH